MYEETLKLHTRHHENLKSHIDSFDSEQNPVMGSSEHGNETLESP